MQSAPGIYGDSNNLMEPYCGVQKRRLPGFKHEHGCKKKKKKGHVSLLDNAKSNNFKCLGLETQTSVDNEDIIMGFRGNCSLSASAHKSQSLTFNGQRWSNVSDCSAPEGSKGDKTTVYLLKWKCLL